MKTSSMTDLINYQSLVYLNKCGDKCDLTNNECIAMVNASDYNKQFKLDDTTDGINFAVLKTRGIAWE
jgi:hypothetical protein